MKIHLNRKNLGTLLLYYLIVLILLFSGFSKIIDPENFLKVLNISLSFLSADQIILVATVLPVIEIAIALMLILKIKNKETLVAAVILFFVFLVFAIYGTIAGFNADCGCFGDSLRSEFGTWMIVRNMILLVITFFNLKYFNWRVAN